MLKYLTQYRTIFILLGFFCIIKLISGNPAVVETYYTYGCYPVISHLMRRLFGWLPFSFGDVLYGAAGIYLVYFIWNLIKRLRRNELKKRRHQLFQNLITTLLILVILFNVLWGLNYNRQGIASQLQLQVQPYTLPDVMQLTEALQKRLNVYAAQADTTKRFALNKNKQLFQTAIVVYKNAAQNFSFLNYPAPSMKPSLYSGIGHYFGFTGYYNPFTGEAQIKTSIPVFLKPFVTTHEIAHQLGYAKENEANFVAFLATHRATDPNFLYSVYYNLYRYALREVYSSDTAAAIGFERRLHPQVLRDDAELKAYFKRTENGLEPIITRFYDQYLKWNNQKAGMQSYNQVVALLVAYGKRWGWKEI